MKYAWILICALSAAVMLNLPAQASKLEQGREYVSGEFVEVPEAGVGFVVPAGWRGTLPKGIDMFVMTPDNESYIFAFARKMKKEELKKMFSTPIHLSNGISLFPTSDPFVSYREISVPYRVGKSDDAMAGYGRAKQGPNGSVVGFIAAGPISHGAALAVLTKQLTAGSTFFTATESKKQ